MTITDPVVTRIPVSEGTIDDLKKHVQAACNLELWTLPLYLTALASIQSDSSNIELPAKRLRGGPRRHTTVTRLLVSVALQEMYHLQLAGNLARLFGEVPRLDWPLYQGRIPYVNRLPAGVEVALGTANDPNTLRLMCAVEAPKEHEKPLDPENPDVPAFRFIQYDAAGEPCYPSIGSLYSIAVQLIDRFRDQVDGGAPQIANGLFSEWYPHTGLIQPGTMDDAVDIIVDQGEGAIGEQAAPIDDPEAVPDQGGFKDPFHAENHFSHWERFTLALENNGAGVSVWPTGTGNDAPAQGALSVIVNRLLGNLRSGWSGERPDLSPMFLVRSAFAQVYVAGQVPALPPVDASSPTYEAAVASAAPPAGATWAQHVQYFFAYTDIQGMKANHVKSPDLGSQSSVRASQSALVAVTSQAQMPPGELNVWSDEQVASFKAWRGD